MSQYSTGACRRGRSLAAVAFGLEEGNLSPREQGRTMKAFGFYGLTTIEKIGVFLARNTFAGRGSVRPSLERLFFGTRKSPRDGLIWGGKAKLRLPPKSNLKYLIIDERYNKPERDYLQAAIREGDVVADIGANIGFYTLWLGSLKVPNTKIVSFEPNPSVFEALVDNVRINGFDNVLTINAAVGEKDGTVSFGVIEDAPSVGSILAKGADQITVPMRTIASVLKEDGLSECNIIKIDVEGYEYQALMPYLEATPVAKWPRLFVIEQNHRASQWEGDLVSAILSKGYRVAARTRGNVVLEKS
jgi:FkbM family methyltransferase